MREKLIELLDDIQRSGTSYEDYEIYGMRIPDTVGNDEVADHLIANNVTVQRWIPVTERLPEVNEEVLTFRDDGDGFSLECIFANGLWEFDLFTPSQVTHWMPLPEPPKDGEVWERKFLGKWVGLHESN